MTPITALQLTISIAGLGFALELLELIVKPRYLSEEGPVPWSIVELQHRWTTSSVASAVLGRLYKRPLAWLVPGLLTATSMPALALLGSSWFWLVQVGSALLALVLVLLAVRSFYGLDGAFHMFLVIFGTVALTAVLPGGIDTELAAGYIGFSAALAYFISGASKLVSPVWRSGAALPGIMSTRAYGHALFYRAISSRVVLSTALCWAVITLEVGAPLAIALGRPPALAFLVLAFGFHASVATLMGLNGFLFAFVATFPCLWYVAGLTLHW